MTDGRRFSLVKPTLETPFHIDFTWWKQNDHNWRIYLRACLCMEHQAAFTSIDEEVKIDWVDPATAEVHPVDGLQDILMSHCALQPDFLTTNTAMVDAVFRVFLAKGNNPLTPAQLATEIGKPAETILRTFSGIQVYKGIRPIQ